MGKDKLRKFNENETFKNVIQPSLEEVLRKDYTLKGKWKSEIFNNENPLVIELGCGKGEYSVGLASKYTEKNFIGIDIKGARIWRGAKTSLNEGIDNVVFLRTRIEFINSFFTKDEVSEIWITFPDPQKEFHRRRKRLTSPIFLNYYKQFLRNDGIVHLKTDSDILYNYTLDIIKHNNIELVFHTSDLYHSSLQNLTHGIKTFYEAKYLAVGKNINYIQFRLQNDCIYEDLPKEE